jgi:hypothetical protein
MCRHGLQQKHSTIIEAMYEWRSNMSGIYIYIYIYGEALPKCSFSRKTSQNLGRGSRGNREIHELNSECWVGDLEVEFVTTFLGGFPG